MKVKRTLSENHAVGWFLFCVRACEPVISEYKGKKNPRLQWTVESSERKSDGERFQLSVWTGQDNSDDERCKLRQLVIACETDPEEFEDTDELIGCIFAGKTAEAEAGFVNIVAFDTRDRVRPPAAAAPVAKKKAAVKVKDTEAEPEFNDPFADE